MDKITLTNNNGEYEIVIKTDDTQLYKTIINTYEKYYKGVNTPDDIIKLYNLNSTSTESTFVPDCCRYCSNHPSNGGSGICNCALPYMTKSGGHLGGSYVNTFSVDTNTTDTQFKKEE